MDELPAHARVVLRRAQECDRCHDEDARRRVREGVARAVGASAVGVGVFNCARVAAQPAAPVAKSAPLLGLVGKLSLTAALVALVGSGIAARRRADEAAERSDPRAPTVSVPPVVTGSTRLAGLPLPLASNGVALRATAPQDRAHGPHVAARQHAGRRSRAALSTSRAGSPETLDAEVVLLRQLEQAVSRRDTHEAQRLLAQHRERFPQPVLLEERHGFSALVGCMQQRTGALATSRAFRARYPNSVLSARVLRECEPEDR